MASSLPLLSFGRCALPSSAEFTISFSTMVVRQLGMIQPPQSSLSSSSSSTTPPAPTSTTVEAISSVVEDSSSTSTPPLHSSSSSISAAAPKSSSNSKQAENLKPYFSRDIELRGLSDYLKGGENVAGGDDQQKLVPDTWHDSTHPTHPIEKKKTKVNSFPFAHAKACPTRHGTYDREAAELKCKGTMYEKPRPAASIVFVTKSTGKILVTQRAAHMRTFPNKWVCPGGGVDDGETFEEAAVREAREEVGIEVTEEQLRFIGCWESCYPPEPTNLAPTRQHFVAFYACLLDDEVPIENLKLQEEECQGAAWIPVPPYDFSITHLKTRNDPPLAGLDPQAIISEGMYFFICETARRYHEGHLWVKAQDGCGPQYVTLGSSI